MELIAKIAVLTNSKSNTLVKILKHLAIPYDIVAPNTELNEITKYQALIVIADEYPKISPNILYIQTLISSFRSERKPIFCEYFPLEGILSDKSITKDYTRLISISNDPIILNNIGKNTLFETHQNRFLLVEKSLDFEIREHLVFGRVAGVYNAIYGLPKTTYLGLGQIDSLLVSTIKISDFEPMEFRLKMKFGRLLMNICHFLCLGWHTIDIKAFNNLFDNRNYGDLMKNIDDGQRKQKYMQTLVDGLDWYENAKMFPKPLGIGGVYEGFSSAFDLEGKKIYRITEELGFRAQRADCTADSATAFLLATQLQEENVLTKKKKDKYKKICNNLFHELYQYWQHFPKEQGIMRGFFGWYNSPYDMNVSYSDDNGRVVLESFLHAYLKKDIELFSKSFAGLIALYNTTGKNGHRWSRIDLNHFYKKKGRKWFRKHKARKNKYKSPHYDAWTFTAILYGTYLIEENELAEKIEKGISDYMRQFPKIPVEHSVGDDFSKLLISCVFLYKKKQKEEHLNYIYKIIDFFEPYQDKETGAFPEIDPFQKHARTEKSNEKYGTGESALYTDSTDTISDQLYSLGFLAMGLFFAHKTGRVPKAHPMLVKLLDYLCMIQLKSPNPQLNGAWTRGFDYRYGEPYGANGDVGWGAYSIETGWTIGPILSSIAFFLLDFDPFKPLKPKFRDKIKETFLQEKRNQEQLEKDWKKNSQKPFNHHTKMTKKEIDEILKGFKINSINTSRNFFRKI